MKIHYSIPLKRQIIIDDHWEIPIQGGKLRIVEEKGYAVALQVSFDRQPLELSPGLQQGLEDGAVATITVRDHQIAFIKRQLDNAAVFLECIHDIELITDDIQARYEGETAEEEAQIKVKSFSFGRNIPALALSFDMLTRAVMAAEKNDGPRFEATLAKSARKALASKEFINSFRYSFLLIESLYGGGQFQKEKLQSAFKENHDLRIYIANAITNYIPARGTYHSKTEILLSSNPPIDKVIDHLVEQRGFYFHGNVKRKDFWSPHKQGVAEALAIFTIDIVQQISINAADPMFAAGLEKRHFENAMHAGAKLMFEVKFRFQQPEERFERESQVNITMPGTKLTSRAAFATVEQFLKIFQHSQPVSALREAHCTVSPTGEKVFDLKFHCGEQQT